MDTTDPEISFNEAGVCSYCTNFEDRIRPAWHPGDEEGKRITDALIKEIKQAGKGKEYDCILGLSGGVDSSYMAYLAHEYGLRPLVVHVDAGWNSELAVKNVEIICKRLGYDLYTHVVDWEEMRDVQLAFLRASVPNQDIPQDHAFFAALYKYAEENGIRYVLNGGNIATESILPRAWGFNAKDLRHLKAIHRRFGENRLNSFPTMSVFKYYVYYPYIWKMKIVRLLNYVDYNKERAMAVLERELDWRYYGGKHYESRFTKFFQAYYLPTKFGFDKRRAHLSSLIVSGQLSREQAKAELAKPLYDEMELRRDKKLVAKKLDIPVEELEALIAAPNVAHTEYPNSENLYKIKIATAKALRKVRLLR